MVFRNEKTNGRKILIQRTDSWRSTKCPLQLIKQLQNMENLLRVKDRQPNKTLMKFLLKNKFIIPHPKTASKIIFLMIENPDKFVCDIRSGYKLILLNWMNLKKRFFRDKKRGWNEL